MTGTPHLPVGRSFTPANSSPAVARQRLPRWRIFHLARQIRRPVGFLNERGQPFAGESPHRLGFAEAARKDHRNARPQRLQPRQRLLPAHHRHRQIQDYAIDGIPAGGAASPRRFRAFFRQQHLVAIMSQGLAPACAQSPRRPPPAPCPRRRHRAARRPVPRAPPLRPAPAAGTRNAVPLPGALATSMAAVPANDSQHRRQTQPAAGELGGEERIENLGLRLRDPSRTPVSRTSSST